MMFADGKKMRRLLSLAALTLCFGSLAANAQTSQGILSGVARDTTGAVLPNAKITITNEETGEVRSTLSKSDGGYRVDAIAPGRYTLVFEEAGFDSKKATGVVISPSVVSSYDAVLAVGKVTDVVEVKAVSNAINLESGQLTGILSSNDIQELPIFSLNPIELATTIPGIQPIVQPSAGQGAQGQSFSAARVRTTSCSMGRRSTTSRLRVRVSSRIFRVRTAQLPFSRTQPRLNSVAPAAL